MPQIRARQVAVRRMTALFFPVPTVYAPCERFLCSHLIHPHTRPRGSLDHCLHILVCCKNRLPSWFWSEPEEGYPAVRRPIVPYVRDASFPVRAAWYTARRRLLDYLIMYVQEGEMIARVERRGYRFRAGDFCFIQPGELHTLEGPAHTITPYIHLDVFHNPARERSFVVRFGPRASRAAPP
jgi:hypothetical protein